MQNDPRLPRRKPRPERRRPNGCITSAFCSSFAAFRERSAALSPTRAREAMKRSIYEPFPRALDYPPSWVLWSAAALWASTLSRRSGRDFNLTATCWRALSWYSCSEPRSWLCSPSPSSPDEQRERAPAEELGKVESGQPLEADWALFLER